MLADSRAAEDVELSSGRGQRFFNKRNAKLFVMTDAKGLQRFVAFAYIGVTTTREIATMNMVLASV